MQRLDNQIAGLDILRFLAAAAVMNFHLSAMGWLVPSSTVGLMIDSDYKMESGLGVTWAGWVGVDVFFVISGFVIALSAEGRSPLAFIRSRSVRLLPGVWICAIVSAALIFIDHAMQTNILVQRFLLTLVIFPLGPWVDGVYWTLVIEIVFYTTVLLVLLRDRFDRIEYVALAMASASLIYWLARVVSLTFDQHFPATVARLLLLQNGGSFASGIAIWLLMFKRFTISRLCILMIGTAAASIEIYYTAQEKLESLGIDGDVMVPEAGYFLGLLALVTSVGVFRLGMKLPPRSAYMVRIIGLATYPLYLTHGLIGGQSADLAMMAGLPTSYALLVGQAVAVLFAIAIATFVEPYFQNIFRRGFDRASDRLVTTSLSRSTVGVAEAARPTP